MKGIVRSSFAVLASVSFLAGCGGSGEDREAAVGAAPAAARVAEGKGMERTEEKEGVHGMEGMQGGGTMVQMQAHMQEMHGADGARVMTMLPEHRQMATNLIAEFDRDIRRMNVPGDAAWTATVDSVRQDLVRLPELSAGEVAAFMPAHEARLNRLMEMHRGMTGGMQM